MDGRQSMLLLTPMTTGCGLARRATGEVFPAECKWLRRRLKMMKNDGWLGWVA